jgi:hypothetical protein
MFLAELIKEKDYIKKSIHNLRDHILVLSIVKNKSDYKLTKPTVDEKLDELYELYSKYQQFSIALERAEATTEIKVTETKLSLADAITIKKSMEDRLMNLEYILKNSVHRERQGEGISCIGIEDMFKEIEKLQLDIKILEAQINITTWQTEVN